MENQLVWQDEFNVGVDVIDQEHQRLFKIINKLLALEEEKGQSPWAYQEGVKYLKNHAVRHFNDEETYMASIGYPGLERHRKIHKGFRDNTLPALEQELERTGYSPDAVGHFLGVCAGWLIGHTLTEDQAITGGKMSTWENLLPEEELEALKKVIIQLVSDMFQLKSQAISDVYGGEKFGKGVYYRLVYGTSQDEKQMEIMMVFEEKLLLNTVGKVMGICADKLSTMLINASRYTARQFVGRVMEHFPDMSSYELAEENLLSYEQFRQVFEREKPQVSLLFNTGDAGYFSYCIIAPHLLEGGIGTPLGAENALDEVERYLQKRESQVRQEEGRAKVLVVDDAASVRLEMEQLLKESYEVTLAESGVAAIRAISLNRPDLVLLDYGMPVCDGRQTLEMLRSDPNFADLPVIFLTARQDTESMRKVIPLKPAGYLLKHSKPEEIKREIDRFFERRKA